MVSSTQTKPLCDFTFFTDSLKYNSLAEQTKQTGKSEGINMSNEHRFIRVIDTV